MKTSFHSYDSLFEKCVMVLYDVLYNGIPSFFHKYIYYMLSKLKGKFGTW